MNLLKIQTKDAKISSKKIEYFYGKKWDQHPQTLITYEGIIQKRGSI